MTPTDANEPLRQLRRVIEDVPEDRLHMRTFSEKAPCGTAYCAAGWAAFDPWFREYTRINKVLQPVEDGSLLVLVNGTHETAAALGRIFAIDWADAETLFGLRLTGHVGPHGVTKAEVIANIDRLLAGDHAAIYAVLRPRVEYRSMRD